MSENEIKRADRFFLTITSRGSARGAAFRYV
nr:MAG TPA: hypothetical protein [Caudoviricetes sp.]